MGEEKKTDEEVKLDEIDMEESKGVTESTEKPVPIAEVKKGKSNKKNFIRIILIVLLICLLAVVAGAYWLRDQAANDLNTKQSAEINTLQAAKISLQKQLAVEKAKTSITPTPTTCSAVAPVASVIESIKSSITSGNTAALEGYMASSVNVVTAASGGVVASTPTVAVSDITSFISGETFEASSWNFALSASILSSYGGGSYAQYFPSIAVVGKSINNKVISFSFDCNAKISTVLLASSENLLQ